MGNKPIIVFSLTKRGCIHYAQTVVELLSKHTSAVYISKFTDPGYPDSSIPLHTYRSLAEALFCTPIFFLRSFFILFPLRNQNKTVYLPSFHPWNLIVCFWCKLFRIPAYLTIHEIDRHAGEKNKLIDHLQMLTGKLSTQIIFLSHYERDKIRSKKGMWNKSKVIPHPIIGAKIVAENTRAHTSRPKLLFLGRKHEYKGLNLLLDMFLQLPANSIESICLAGKGKLPVGYNLQNAAIKNIDKYVTDLEISEFLSQHDILLLPYTEASQSGILAMGIQAKIPMVISKVGGLVEQIPTDAAVFVEPEAASIKNGVISISTDKSLFNKIKANITKAKEAQLKVDAEFASALINW